MRFVVPLLIAAALGIATLAGIVIFQISTRERPAFAGPEPAVRLISSGRPVDVGWHVAEHGYTVIEFLASFAPECRRVATRLDAAVRKRQDVRVRVIDIGSYDSDVASQYDIERVPVLWLYRDGVLVATEVDSVLQQLEAGS